MISKLNKVIPTFFLISSTIFSYSLFLLYYDSTTGLDFNNKYFTYIDHFSFGKSLNLQDGQGVLYYFIISIFVRLKIDNIGPYNINEILNNSIQLGNLFFVVLAYIGLYKLYRQFNYKKNSILTALVFLNFFPPLVYMKLTFKSEIFAFALVPWVFFFFEKIKENKSIEYKFVILFIFSFSLLLTVKPLVTAITLFSFTIFYRKYIKSNFKLLFTSILTSLFLLYLNYSYTGLGFFSFVDNYGLWDNKATPSFFFKFNFLNLIIEPFFNKQSNSFLSILLLDTYSDYFTFFWKHKEPTNFLAYGQVNFFENFFIYNYLRDYLSIVLTLFTYICILYYFFRNKKDKNHFILLFVFFSIIPLIVNSLGIPNNNFNPSTGDTFKTHYYAFMLCISVFHLILRNKFTLSISILLTPVFVFIMGFPKDNLNVNSEQLKYKFNNSELCLSIISGDKCRNEFINICKRDFNKTFYKPRFRTIEFFEPVKLVNDKEYIYVRNSTECLNYLNKGYGYKKDFSN